MANAHELARGHKRLRALIEFALDEGWYVVRTPGGHLKFTKPGCASIYTSSTASAGWMPHQQSHAGQAKNTLSFATAAIRDWPSFANCGLRPSKSGSSVSPACSAPGRNGER